MGSGDWIGTAITGAVGMAGIGATVWVAVSARAAVARQELEAEKRRVYTAMFNHGDRVIAAVKRLELLRAGDPPQARITEALVELDQRRLEANSALYDLLLVAPVGVGELAARLYLQYLDEAERFRAGEAEHRPAGFAAARRELLYAMRHDLGRGPLALPDSPSMSVARAGAGEETADCDDSAMGTGASGPGAADGERGPIGAGGGGDGVAVGVGGSVGAGGGGDVGGRRRRRARWPGRWVRGGGR